MATHIFSTIEKLYRKALFELLTSKNISLLSKDDITPYTPFIKYSKYKEFADSGICDGIKPEIPGFSDENIKQYFKTCTASFDSYGVGNERYRTKNQTEARKFICGTKTLFVIKKENSKLKLTK